MTSTTNTAPSEQRHDRHQQHARSAVGTTPAHGAGPGPRPGTASSSSTSSSVSAGLRQRSAAIYARVSSARQKKDETIGSQTAALREYAAAAGLTVPEQWVFEDDGHSGATLARPALERLRDLVAGVGVEVVICYSPDRLARKFAYQALLIEEFTRAGTRPKWWISAIAS